MVSGKWLQIDSKWYYFCANGFLAKDTEADAMRSDRTVREKRNRSKK